MTLQVFTILSFAGFYDCSKSSYFINCRLLGILYESINATDFNLK